MKLHIALLFLMIIGFETKAQTIVTIGNSVDTSISASLKRKPLGSYYGFERSALLIKKEEINLNTSMALSKISFLCDTITSSIANATPVKIFLSETNDSLFSGPTSVQLEENNGLPVYNGIVNATSFSQGSFIEIVLDIPFVYSNSQNLKLIIETNAGGNGNESALAKGFAFSLEDSNQFQYWQQDNTPPSGIGTLQHLRPVCKLSFDSIPVCNGIPQAGNAVSSFNSVCNSETFLLSLTNTNLASGLTYQWESSTNGTIWSILSGANHPSYTSTVNDTTFFRCIVSCLSDSDTSTVVMIYQKEPTDCYCTSLGGGCQGFSIDSLSIFELQYNHSSSGCANTVQAHYSYYDLSNQFQDTLIAGQSYQLSSKFTGDNVAGFWIDFDRDGWFENYEYNSICTTSVTGTIYSKTFTVPSNAVNGKTTLRIRTRNKVAGLDSSMACTLFGSGETEDYRFTISGGQNVGIGQKFNFANTLLFPNPTNEKINLIFPNEFSGNIILLNTNGSKLFETVIERQLKIQIDLSSYNRGLYFLIARDAEGNSINRKIIIN